jgi:hypothetical protein
MARQGRQIHNPRTGQRMTFVELTDDILRIDTVNPPTTEHEPLHVHPAQESGAEVLSGSLVFEIGGDRRRELRPLSPPWPVLRALSAILAPIARRRGYRARLDLP